MANKRELINQRKKELLAKGYKPGIVNLAMEWAIGCAQGNADHFQKQGVKVDLTNEILPSFLKDAEKWILSLHGPPSGKSGKELEE
jgi:hypothetical protein